MIAIWGVDTGASRVGLVGIVGEQLIIEVFKGNSRPRPSKKNPDPEPLNEYAEAWSMARRILKRTEGITGDFRLFAEGPALGHRMSRQDTLGAARQAIYCALEVEGLGALFGTITPAQAKKALAGYAGADKRRMVEAADAKLQSRWGWSTHALAHHGPKDQETIADALGVALAGEILLGSAETRNPEADT